MSRTLEPPDLHALARGCDILGAGGGGDPHIALLQALQAIEECGPVSLVDLDELDDDALIMPCGGIGAPTVSLEKFENGDEGGRLRDHLEQLTGRRVAALMSAEIGGGNGLQPISWAARIGLPVLDADGMGRAFPEVPQVSMHVAGISPSPCVLTDERGNVLVVRAVSGPWLERLARAATVELGGTAASAEYTLTVAQAREATLRGSVSLAMRIGQATVGAADPVAAVLAATGGFRLVTGKITDVERRTTGGFARGSVEVEGLGADAGRLVGLQFQNENLVALELDPAAGRRFGGDRAIGVWGVPGEHCVPPGQHVMASVPDLITMLDTETAGAIGTERLRYGQRVTVIAFGCHALWRTPAGLALAGPRAFGYDVDYVPVEDSPVRDADCRLGIDVGGTNTDAVILDAADRVLAKAKVPGTADITGGITAALDAVLAEPAADPARISHVMLGTTHATNAVLERRLRRVAVIRIGGPATRSIRPMYGWPPDAAAAVSAGAIIVDGGIEFDGRDLAPLDTDGIARFLGQAGPAAEGVAITSVFAPVSDRHELAAADIVRRELGGVHVSLSHQIGSLGLLERENATILNAALAGVASDVAGALRAALAARGLAAATFFAQNDGTLMTLDHALRYPVLTIGSGPASSLRGAAFLSGVKDALAVDVGGTSTDVGVLVGGFPRESSQGAEIGGIRTNFRMPDLVTIALGGGTVVDGDGGGPPRSVGYRLTREALVFGGRTPTMTDAAVACGRAVIGDPALVRGPVTEELARATRRADARLADAIDRVKTARGDLTLIAVGGGSILVPDRLPGVSQVIRPEHFDAANAIGAAIAAVSGQVDRIFHLGAGGRTAALDEARGAARERAISAGADPDTVEIVEIEEIPLAYLTNPAVRIRVKAAGTLSRRLA